MKAVIMQNEQQFEQLMLQYQQLKNGSEDIKKMIINEDFDGAITKIKSRESIFLNCKCMRKFLELTPVQENELNKLLDELRTSELDNIKTLQEGMLQVQQELRKTQQNEKFQHAYDIDKLQTGSIINYSE